MPQTTPVALTPIAEDSGARLITQAELLANATDIEGDALTATGLSIASGNGTLVDNGDGTWNYTPDNNDDSDVAFTYIITDGAANVVAAATLDITPVNDAPTSTPVALTPIAEDSGVRLIIQADLLANSTDVEGDILTANGLTIATGNGTLVDNGDDTWNYTPDSNDDSDASFNYNITDGTANVASTATLDITPVNDAPQSTPVVLTPIVEDSGVRVITQAELLASVTDIEGDALNANGLTVANGNGNLVDNGDGTWSYTPATNDNSAVNFSYNISDGTDEVTGTATLDITPVNDAPIGTDNTVTALEDTDFVFAVTDFTFADAIDGNTLLAVIIDTIPENGQLILDGTVVVAGEIVLVADIDAGYLTFQPDNDASGVNYAGFTFRVQDDGGITNGGMDTDATTRSMTIDVASVNDAPDGTDNTVTTLEDTDYSFSIADFGFSDSSDNDGFLAVAIDTLPGNGQLLLNGSAVIAGETISVSDIAAGELVFKPAIDGHGLNYANFSFRVQDDGGTANGGNDIDVTARTITIDVTSVDDAPTGTDTTISTLEGTDYVFSSNDFGFSDVADDNALSFITVTSLPNIGTLLHQGIAVNPGDTISATSLDTGELVYQPPSNANAPALDASGSAQNSFNFTVTDNGSLALGGENTSSTEHVISIDLTQVNDSPILVSNGATVDEGGTIIIDSTLLGGTDPDDTEPDDLILTVTTLPLHGQLLLNGEVVTAGTTLTLETIAAGSLIYIHDESETSADGFDVSLADGGEDGALVAQGRFELAITEVIDEAVELNPDTLRLAFGESFDSAQGNLLESGFSGLNSDSLSGNTALLVELVVPPAQGTVELHPDGTFTYVHNGSAILNDGFTYRVTNEDGISTTATVGITIDPPIAPAVDENIILVDTLFPDPVAEQTDNQIITEVTENEVVQTNNVESTPEQQLSETTIPLFPENRISENRTTTSLNQVETQELPEVDTLRSDFVTRETISVTQHREIAGITTYNEVQDVSSATYDLILDVHVPSPKAATSNSGFIQGLSQLENDFTELEEENGARFKLIEDTVLGASFSVSVGALAWALRGGAMMASMMAFTPLWKFVELGQVTNIATRSKSDDKASDEPDDNVESLFDKS